jgi:RNA polymerase sigma-70 factor, ECF subfamily
VTIGQGFDEVIVAARGGREWALEALYRDLAPSVLAYLRTQGAADPEDLTSEVFVGLIRNLRRFEGDERHFRAWVFSIAHRRLLDQYRWRSRREEQLMDPRDLARLLALRSRGDVEEEAFERVGSRWAVEALFTLSSDQRAVLLLRVIADLPIAQVAQVLGKSVGAVKSLQSRALLALARKIEEDAVS